MASISHLLPSIFLLLTPTLTTAQHAHSNGIDPAMDMPMPLAQGNMISFLHFTPGDTLWLEGWVPGRGSTLFGACVGLFLLGVAERWIAALRVGVESAIRKDVVRGGGRRHCAVDEKEKKVQRPLRDVLLMRGGTVAPFIIEHAWARFMLHGLQAALAMMFMLTVMTFQVSFILSIVIGVGVGEMMYGRFTDAVHAEIQEERY